MNIKIFPKDTQVICDQCEWLDKMNQDMVAIKQEDNYLYQLKDFSFLSCGHYGRHWIKD